METKYDYIISGNKNTLDTLQAHVVLIKKFYDGTLYHITDVSRSEDKSQLYIRVEDEATKAEHFRDMIRYRFPGLRVMMIRLMKNNVDHDG